MQMREEFRGGGWGLKSESEGSKRDGEGLRIRGPRRDAEGCVRSSALTGAVLVLLLVLLLLLRCVLATALAPCLNCDRSTHHSFQTPTMLHVVCLRFIVICRSHALDDVIALPTSAQPVHVHFGGTSWAGISVRSCPSFHTVMFGIQATAADSWEQHGLLPVLPHLAKLQQVSQIEVHVEDVQQLPAQLPEQVQQSVPQLWKVDEVHGEVGTGLGVDEGCRVCLF